MEDITRGIIPEFDKSPHTKMKLLDTATKLFALKGFGAVPLREIANELDIKISAVYHYFEDKDALIDAVLERFEKTYREYFDWLSAINSGAYTLEEVMSNVFNREFTDSLNPVVRLGMSMLFRSRFENERAGKFFCKDIFGDSVRNIQEAFDRLVRLEVIPRSDTKMLAKFFISCVISCNEIYIREVIDGETSETYNEFFKSLRELITAALVHGVLEVPADRRPIS